MKFLILILFIYLSTPAAGASGSLASDSPCTLNQGATRCTVTITASANNTPVSCIWKTTPSLGLVGCSGSSNWNQPWEWTNTSGHTMELRAHSTNPVNNQTGYGQGTLLDQINVIATLPAVATGSLVSDSPCTLNQGATRCTVTITASANNTPVSCIWKTTPSLGLVGCSGSSSWNQPWEWTNTSGHTMQLKAHSSTPANNQTGFNQGTYLDEISVMANPSSTGSLSSDSPCVLPQGASRCTVSITSSVQNASVSCIWKTTPSLGLVGCSNSSSWVQTWEWANTSGHTMQLKAHDNMPSNNQTSFNQGTYLDQIVVSAQQQSPSVANGGSVFAWYRHTTGGSLDDGSTGRIMPYGIIKNYHLIDQSTNQPVRNLVINQLNQMYQDGQRKIGVDFFYGRSSQWFSHGTYINSRAKENTLGGVYYIESQYLTNLANYLNDIDSAGFEQILFNFLPGGANYPSIWTHWYLSYEKDLDYTFDGSSLITAGYNPKDPEPRWQQTPVWRENWQVIKTVTNVLVASGVDFIVDVQNEAIPLVDSEGYASCANPQFDTGCSCINSGQSNWQQCLAAHPTALDVYQERTEAMMRKIWNKFKNNFPSVKTSGFSIISTSDWQLEQRSQTMSNIYGARNPDYLNLHIYNSSTPGVTAIFNRAKNLPGGGNIIIGETFYNDMGSAIAFRNAQQASGANINFVIQWPVSAQDGYNYPLPLSFEEYMLENY
ncbi:hypothetical protein [Marinicella sp. W31]|uniref:hypothetical protein n=1 Tax=Marinicella sp. W31 TaxID=3023713 RepID=UPI0037570156